MKKLLSVIADINKTAFEFSKSMYIAETIFFLLNALAFSLSLYVQQYFFDGVTGLIGDDASEKTVIRGLILFVALNLLTYIFGCFCNSLPSIMQSGIRIKLREKLQNKAASFPYINYENTDFLDRLNKAEEGRYNSVGLYYIVRQIACFYLPYFIFISVYLFKINAIIGAGVLVIFLPIIISHIIHVKLYTKLEDEIAPIRRLNSHFDSCITSRQFFKETRLYGAVAFFYKKFSMTLKKLLETRYKTDMKVCRIDTVIRLFISFLYCGILVFMFFLLIHKQITIGLFIALNTSIGTVFSMMEDLAYSKIGYISTQLGSIYNYYDFINDDSNKEYGKNIVLDVKGDIVLKNVSFRYPYAKETALHNISLTLKEGETIAVVGENGSGKSTLSKVMMGLIPSDDGDVYYGDTKIEKQNANSIYTNISAIFQNFSKYSINLRNNIIISDYEKEREKAELKKLCDSIGLDPYSEKFPDSFDTILSRDFKGIDVSGGEWQKIAIIRGKYRRHKYIFLDEPTSAIDPIEEMKLYKAFSEISKDVSSVIITHRLGAARLADQIVVMKNGRIVEIGTHESLLKNKNEYYRLWQLQKQWYIN